MATKTGNSYTTGTATDSVEIPTTYPGFSTMATSPNKVSPSDCDNDRMAMWPSKPEILISGTMADRMTIDNSNCKSGAFDHAQREETDPERS